MERKEVIKRFSLTTTQSKKIDKYVFELLEFNKHTNLIGKSTLKNIWERHIADSLQLSFYIEKKNIKIFSLDLSKHPTSIPIGVSLWSAVSDLSKSRYSDLEVNIL